MPEGRAGRSPSLVTGTGGGLGDGVLGVPIERQSGVDEPDVAERLGRVAQLSPGVRVPLLAEQADVVAQVEQPFEEPTGLACRPVSASASASQKLQARKAPSEPGSPSTVPWSEVGSASVR